MNNTPVADVYQKLSATDLIDGGVVFLRVGSQKQAVIVLVEE